MLSYAAKRVHGCKKAPVLICVAMCLTALLCCSSPLLAWAGGSPDLPKGKLTLFEDPFSMGQEQYQGRYEEGIVFAEESELNESAELLLSNNAYAMVDGLVEGRISAEDEGASTCASGSYRQNGNQEASTEASSHTANVEISISATDEALILGNDEGLYSHEDATVLVAVEPGLSRPALKTMLADVMSVRAMDVSDEDLAYGLVKLSVLPGISIENAIESLKLIPGVKSAQPNYVYSIQDEEESYTLIDDPYAFRQWELYNANTFAAWDLVKTQGSVAVAVIDTGADLDHPDLAANIVATRNTVSSDNTVEDQVGHGTHVAGTIAGVANNGRGIAGSSYNASLVIIKASAYKSSDFDTASIVRAFAWLGSFDSSGKTVAEHYNVRVVNMSIGGWDETRGANYPDDALFQAITKARDELGLLVVVAAGNRSPDDAPYFAYPGDCDACLSVMNLSETYNDDGEPVGVELDTSSNYNVAGTNYKDICASGTDIYSTWINGRYAIDSGTSMAAPVVSGIAALLYAANPNLTPQAAMCVLETTATDLGDAGWDERHGYGAVNAAAAVRKINGVKVNGWKVVGLGGSAAYTVSLGNGLENNGLGYTWQIWQGEGGASVDSLGKLYGWAEGDVTLVAKCEVTTGAEISATKVVYIIDPDIIGDESLHVGDSSRVYATTDQRWTWVWDVENYTGRAHIDQDAILVADKPGIVYVTATCASNTSIVLMKQVVITEI